MPSKWKKRAKITERGICLEPGVHFLPLKAVNMVEAQLCRFEQRRDELVQKFLDAYPRSARRCKKTPEKVL
jgi:hypothetical protein